jgi:hypothetical protein
MGTALCVAWMTKPPIDFGSFQGLVKNLRATGVLSLTSRRRALDQALQVVDVDLHVTPSASAKTPPRRVLRGHKTA